VPDASSPAPTQGAADGSPASAPGAPRTPGPLRAAVQELLRYGLVEAAFRPHLYQTLCRDTALARAILEPLDLQLRLDEVRGLAFLCVADGFGADGQEAADAWTHPLVRRQRLTAEQTLLLAVLRRHLVAHEQQAGIGAGEARVSLAELWAELGVYLGDSGSDRRDDRRLRELLQRLREHGVVSDIEADDTVLLRPILAQVLDPAGLEAILHAFVRMAVDADGQPPAPT